ncbi:hypothetical protein [Jannaschia aquimarina]|uniref:Phytase-like domain-containing protein n=1 Tax=Jannaschia aquimarina TaxID=935700 RepID=A0A0D1EGQ6_9RHOB|nr:hypothetical protein [Jannaschia aquimarina]KIT16794.1 hypothetical protein jaqu_15820 [Jannaschia aquimarina]SNS52208.1 hypothetical protein SAMN05421775_101296 [Jannaschia aquimarina]
MGIEHVRTVTIDETNSGPWFFPPYYDWDLDVGDGGGDGFLLAQTDYKSIYIQRLDENGDPEGDLVLVATDLVEYNGEFPSGVVQEARIVELENGNVLVHWTQIDADPFSIHGVILDPDLAAVSNPFMLIENTSQTLFAPIDFAPTGDGGVLVLSPSGPLEDMSIAVRRFDAEGRPIGSEVEIDDDPGAALGGREQIVELPEGRSLAI